MVMRIDNEYLSVRETLFENQSVPISTYGMSMISLEHCLSFFWGITKMWRIFSIGNLYQTRKGFEKFRSEPTMSGYVLMVFQYFRILNGKQVVSQRWLGEIWPKRSIPET